MITQRRDNVAIRSMIQDYIQAYGWRENGVGLMFACWFGYHHFKICKLHRQAYVQNREVDT
jgi:hypothetical protein